MRCPKCNSVLPIGGEVCKSCNYNIYKNQYEQPKPQPKPQPAPQPKPEFEITDSGELIAYNGTSVHVTIPSSVRRISKPVFAGNTRIQTVTVNDGLIGLGRDVFRNCTQLREVTLPSSLSVLNLVSFSGCSNLQRICVRYGLPKLLTGNELAQLPALTLELPDSITSMTWFGMSDEERTARMRFRKTVVASEAFYQRFSNFFAENPDFVCTRNGRQPDPVPPTPVPPTPVPPKPTPPKPKGGFLKRLVIVILACLIGRGIGHAFGTWMAQRQLSASSSSKSFREEEVIPETTELKEASPEFRAFLQSHGIVDYIPNIRDKSVECFAIEQEDGIFEFMEIGHSGDTIQEILDMIYVPISGLSQAEADSLQTALLQEFAPHDALDNCTVTYERDQYYLVIMLSYQDVHKSANIRAMTDIGIVEKDFVTGQYATTVSLTITRADLLAQGAVMR